MKNHTIALVLTTTLLLLNTATAQQIIKDKPTPSRAEWAPLGQAYGRDYSTSDVTKVVVIGSGTPTPDTRHSGISVAVVVNGEPYIIDCGPGFWRNSQASTPALGGKIAGLESKKLHHLFITHLHFDHTEGMPLIPGAELRTLFRVPDYSESRVVAHVAPVEFQWLVTGSSA